MIRFVNFYPPCDDTTSAHPWRTTSWDTQELADRNAQPGRIACIMVEFEPGQGLDRIEARDPRKEQYR